MHESRVFFLRSRPISFSKKKRKKKKRTFGGIRTRTIIEEPGTRENNACSACERSLRIQLLPRVIHQSNVENNGQIPFALAVRFLSRIRYYNVTQDFRIVSSLSIYESMIILARPRARVHGFLSSISVEQCSQFPPHFPSPIRR